MERITDNIFMYPTRKGPRFMARVDRDYRSIRRKGFVTKTQASDWLTLYRAALVDQKYFPERIEAPVLQDLAEQWLNDSAHTNLRHNTIRSYRANLNTHIVPILGSLALNRITRTHIADFITIKKRERKGKPYSRDAIRLMLAPLSSIFTEALDSGRYGIEVNPCLRPGRLIKIKTRKKTLKAYTPAEEAAILTSCKALRPDQYPLFCTLFWSGLRPGEAWALEVADLLLRKKLIHVSKTFTDGELHDTPKTGQTRLVEIPDTLVTALKATTNTYAKVEKLVFPGRDGAHRHQSMWNRKIWTPIVRAAQAPHYPPYATRHTYATRQLERGCSLQWLMHQLGHSSVKMTVDTYGHLARSKT